MFNSNFSLENILKINQRLMRKKDDPGEPQKLSGYFDISSQNLNFDQEKIHNSWQKIMVKYA